MPNPNIDAFRKYEEKKQQYTDEWINKNLKQRNDKNGKAVKCPEDLIVHRFSEKDYEEFNKDYEEIQESLLTQDIRMARTSILHANVACDTKTRVVFAKKSQKKTMV